MLVCYMVCCCVSVVAWVVVLFCDVNNLRYFAHCFVQISALVSYEPYLVAEIWHSSLVQYERFQFLVLHYVITIRYNQLPSRTT